MSDWDKTSEHEWSLVTNEHTLLGSSIVHRAGCGDWSIRWPQERQALHVSVGASGAQYLHLDLTKVAS